jgi:GxxExxY protein
MFFGIDHQFDDLNAKILTDNLSCMSENDIAKIIWDICYNIHIKLGTGLFESVYEDILAYELEKQGLFFERQKAIPLIWEEINMETAFRADFIVERKVIVELKSIEEIHAVHKKQVLTYLKITNLKLGLLVNFKTTLLKDGFFRLANNLI